MEAGGIEPAVRGTQGYSALERRGFFGGEGFIMQKLQGDGLAFMHGGGTIVKRDLAPGEHLRVDTGCLMGFTQDVDYDIVYVKGIKNMVFGGEGLFFASLIGPGSVWIQTLPFSRLADRVMSHAPRCGGARRCGADAAKARGPSWVVSEMSSWGINRAGKIKKPP